MTKNCYDVYINNRPVRIAFIINPKNIGFDQINHFFKFNYDKWGGRYNPIIFSDGKKISNEWWNFLRKYDPDIIKSLIPIGKNLLKKIDLFLSPYSVEIPRENEKKDYHSIEVSDDIISINPTPEILAKITHTYLGEATFAIFDTKSTLDDNIKRFVNFNFGNYPFSYWSKKIIDAINVKTFEITDMDSLLYSLDELSKFKPYVYPSQLCTIPNNLFDLKYDRMQDTFSIFIGDSFDDIFFFWNSFLLVPKHRRTSLNQLWLPKKLADNVDFQNSLRNWLKSNARPNNRNIAEIQFISASLTKKELETIVANFTIDSWCHSFFYIIKEPKIPNYQEWYLSEQIIDKSDMYRIDENVEQIILNEPDIPGMSIFNQKWMSDVYIKFGTDRYRYITGQTFWYKLPQNNRLAHTIFHQTSRICSNGYPSILIGRGNCKVRINIPEDKLMFHILITNKKNAINKWDARSKLSYDELGCIRKSDKGKYLLGVIDLFKELPSAYNIIEKRYWRRVFGILSNRKLESDNNKLKAIQNKLNKKLMKGQGSTFNTNQSIEWLSNYLLQIAKEISITNKELPYDFFIKESEQEINDFNSLNINDNKFEVDENDLKNTISDLLELRVLLIGLSSHCPRCGYSNWDHLNDAKQVINCSGCNYYYSVTSEPQWHYRLNNLVRISCAYHGLFPVILVLGQLLHDSRNSFFYMPSLEVLKDWDSNPIGEIDIVCVNDGKFIIGEVKENLKLFRHSDFDKMAELARFIKVDKIIFSSLDGKPNTFIKNNIKRIKKELSDLEIDIEWYQLHNFIFEPSPIF